ncbi:MAG: riboflavin kinase [Parcubacteria group bacterium]|nr:riboflavin kinase [Parcubacteria group bacterium]
MYRFKAKVISGRGRGKQIGFPTANLDAGDLPIAYAVYLVKAKLGRKTCRGLLHYGPKKTFSEPVSVEVYLKNFNQDIYGRALEIEVGRKIRPVRKFDNAEALKRQIEKDLLELNNS